MTADQIRQSLATGKLKLSPREALVHFAAVGFLFALPAFFTFLQTKNVLAGTPQPLESASVFILAIAFTLGLFFLRIQHKRLYFETIRTPLDREQIDTIISNVARELGWDLCAKGKNGVLAQTRPGLITGSWGERITILIDRDRVLVNSICDPTRKSSLVSMGRNRMNMTTLIEAIRHASHTSSYSAAA